LYFWFIKNQFNMILSGFRMLITLVFILSATLCMAQAGSIDPTFNTGSGANERIRSMSLQPDGKIIIGGDFTQYNLAGFTRLARVTTDGNFDVTFPSTSANEGVYATELQPDGKVMIGGVFSNYQGPRMRIARVDVDANLDPTFNPGSGASGVVRDFVILPDGKILVAGNLVTYNDTTVNRIAKLNSDGTLDLSFNTGTAFNGNSYALAVQPDGKILVCGFFITFNGQSERRITRLNSDGSLDEMFDQGTGADAIVRNVVLQPDGKILIAGGFASFNGTSVNRIARLNSDGSLDDTFEIGTGFDNDIYALALQPDGKVVVGGDFSAFDGTPVNRVARLNADGSLDNTFDAGIGPNQRVEDIAIQPDGKILVAGAFTTFNGAPHNRLVRLLGDAIDCNGDEDGTAYFDQCGVCVGGNTGLEPCEADCNGEFGGTAFLDECDNCVGGNTGLEPCEEDCNGDFGGTAYIDECDMCVEGNTGLEPCVADCNGDFGGTAFIDECDICVSGNTGLEPCEADCNGDFGGTAYLDECEVCVEGNTGLEPCEADCNGDFGGTAFIDECDTCVGGNTGLEPCEEDCHGDFGGTAYLDECNECVEGNTGSEPCYGGCINSEACNFDPDAGFDDGTCVLVGDDCDDGNPETENDVIQDDCECEGELITGINESETNSKIHVFPNPATTVLTVITSERTSISHARILDTNGKTLITQSFSETAVFDVADLASGVYILVVENTAGQSRSKIIIAR